MSALLVRECGTVSPQADVARSPTDGMQAARGGAVAGYFFKAARGRDSGLWFTRCRAQLIEKDARLVGTRAVSPGQEQFERRACLRDSLFRTLKSG
jgi:hypothetical protein